MKAKESKKYLLFVNYGTDGWALMDDADSPDELLECARVVGYTGEWLIVKKVEFKAED